LALWMQQEQANGATMLSHCANSQCVRPFVRLGQGKLFLVENEYGANPAEFITPPSPHMRKQPRRVERYWLCDQCAELWTLVHDRKQGIGLVPLLRPLAGARVAMADEHREEHRESA